ncbi:MAG: DJ-1/PfpI family protein [Candidatus Izemoplasmatales bacterium]|nr:DJ-1/PfpI family protein [Candidatus Izemoplasmatales bacterium]
MRIACLLSDGFEEIEAIGTIALLRRSGIECELVNVFNKKSVTGSYGITVMTTMSLKAVKVTDFDGLFIPGGGHAKVLRETPTVLELVETFHKQNKWLMAICAGPSVFGVLGILDNVHYTSFPGTEKYMPKGIRMNEKAVRDNLIITGIGAGAVYEFAFEIIKALLGECLKDEVSRRILY